jgi:hypothetical protein
MKKLLSLFCLLFLLSSLTYSQENYKKIKIISENLKSDIELLRTHGVVVDEGFVEKGKSISVFLSASDFARLQQSGVRYEIEIDDWDGYYKNLPLLSESEKQATISDSKTNFGVEGLTYGSMGGYYTYA